MSSTCAPNWRSCCLHDKLDALRSDELARLVASQAETIELLKAKLGGT
jgi:hypothetical protein